MKKLRCECTEVSSLGRIEAGREYQDSLSDDIKETLDRLAHEWARQVVNKSYVLVEITGNYDTDIENWLWAANEVDKSILRSWSWWDPILNVIRESGNEDAALGFFENRLDFYIRNEIEESLKHEYKRRGFG